MEQDFPNIKRVYPNNYSGYIPKIMPLDKPDHKIDEIYLMMQELKITGMPTAFID